MAESEMIPFQMAGKQYVIPEDLAKAMPIYHANHIQLSVTDDGVGLIFCTRFDTLGSNPGSADAIPHAACFISTKQAETLGRVLTEAVTQVKAVMQAAEEEAKKNVR